MKTILLTAIIFFMIQTISYAQWSQIGTYSGAKMSINKSTIEKKKNGNVIGQVRFVNSSPQPVADGSSIKYVTVVSEYECNCTKKQYKRNIVVYYDANDKPVYKGRKTSWQSVGNNAAGDVLKFMCK